MKKFILCLFVLIFIIAGDIHIAEGNSHVCSFQVKCSKEHCDIKICLECGKHQNNASCGGGCVYKTCNHCRGYFCTICTDHFEEGFECKCNENGYCSKPHCPDKNDVCSWCHTCDGDHKFDSMVCSMYHCDDLVCTVSGCNEHLSGKCAGGHTEGSWFLDGKKHKLYCGVSGCNTVLESYTHDAVWKASNSTHTSNCEKCGLTYVHTPVWSEYEYVGGVHTRYCNVVIDGSSCPATDSHSISWTGYVKADDEGEESGAEHVRKCTVSGCNLITDAHGWSDLDKWYMIDENKHERICSTCGLTQILPHNFISRELIEDNIEEHYKVCMLCFDEDKNYRVKENHVDGELEGRGNGRCDLCNKELWRITFSDLNPTNQDITVKVEMFSDYEDKIEVPTKMIDLDDNEHISQNGVYTINKNTDSESDKYYIFRFETPDVNVPVEVTNISKEIYGRVEISPDVATKGAVTLKLVVSDEGVDKSIDLKFENEDWNNDVLFLSKEVHTNGEYTFYARDSLGNGQYPSDPIEFTVNVNNIVSGFGSVTTTFDAFQGGYIFTDILVNVNQEWILDDVIINCLESSVYKYKVDDDNAKTAINESVNKVQITDEMGNIVTGNILKSGFYYVKVAIGGPGVFDEVGTYMVEIEDTRIKYNGETLLNLAGKNRIEVVVQSLNDLT